MGTEQQAAKAVIRRASRVNRSPFQRSTEASVGPLTRFGAVPGVDRAFVHEQLVGPVAFEVGDDQLEALVRVSATLSRSMAWSPLGRTSQIVRQHGTGCSAWVPMAATNSTPRPCDGR